MPNRVMAAANTVIQVDGVTVAKITAFNENHTLSEQDVTGVEDTSGALVIEQFLPVSIGDTIDFEGIVVSGEGETIPQDMEPGQQDVHDKMSVGQQATVGHEMPSGFGKLFTGYFLTFKRGISSPKGVYTFSASMRVNSTVPTP